MYQIVTHILKPTHVNGVGLSGNRRSNCPYRSIVSLTVCNSVRVWMLASILYKAIFSKDDCAHVLFGMITL